MFAKDLSNKIFLPLIAAGAGVSESGWVYWGGVPGNYMEMLRAGSPAYAALQDPRIKAIAVLAPWGGHYGTWDNRCCNNINQHFITRKIPPNIK
jgi:hypothetical protein